MLESKRDLTRVKNTINQQSLLNPKMRLYSPWGKQLNWGPPFCSISLLGLGGVAKAKARQNFKELQMPFESPQRFCKENSSYKRLTPLQLGGRNGSHWQEKKTSKKVSSNVCLPKRIRLLAREGEGQNGMDGVGCIQRCCSLQYQLHFPSIVIYKAFYTSHLHILLYNAVSESHYCLTDQD